LLAAPSATRERLQQAATRCADAAAAAAPLLPFQPASYRDFMLYERHVIDATRGYVRRFMPRALPLALGWERLTRRTFPAFRPKPLWYRQPIYYMGNYLAFVADGSQIRWPAYAQVLDYELELGFVLTKPLVDANPAEAEAAIGGFVVFNDWSARDVQRAEMDSGFGPQKAKHFCNAMSAVLVSADEILPRWQSLSGRVRINGRTVAEVSTAGPRYSLGEALAHASRGETLHPGEFFATGTLPGGSGMENGHYPAPGDTVELELDGVGRLSNRVSTPT
jgi:2-keto-4-pentenoate hydratase/2-oxohepta-3-ene-1,7-dioic acid hydratase in catechol pathway